MGSSVEEEDALVHDATDGTSSRDQATAEASGATGHEWYNTVYGSTRSLKKCATHLFTMIGPHARAAIDHELRGIKGHHGSN